MPEEEKPLLHQLRKGDIFSTIYSMRFPREFHLYHIKTYYIYLRVWYKPWTWFKKVYLNQYEVLEEPNMTNKKEAQNA